MGDEMDETLDAPMPTGCRSTYLVVTCGSGSERDEGKDEKEENEDLEGSTEDAEFDKRHGYEEMVKGRGNRG